MNKNNVYRKEGCYEGVEGMWLWKKEKDQQES